MRRTFTSFDIAAIVSELKDRLEGARIQNIYQTNRKTLILKLHRPNHPNLNLLIEAGKRLHLTVYILDKPQKPPGFCMALRKHLKNGFITEINQQEFERIVTIKVKTKMGEFNIVVELFGDGNILLVDPQNFIQHALTFKRMRDRNILRKEPFRFPPTSGKNPLHLTLTDLHELKKFRDLDVVKAITRTLSISGKFAEEILLRAQVDKNKRSEHLENTDFKKIYIAIRELFTHVENAEYTPSIVIDERGRWIDAVPVIMEKIKKIKKSKLKKFDSFNEALDEFYAKATVELETTAVSESVEEETARQRRILNDQRRVLEEARKKPERMRRIGDVIYSHLNQLQTLMQRILDGKRRGLRWQEIIAGIEDEKERGEIPAAFFESLDTKNLILQVSIVDLSFSLNLRSSIQENAATYYSKGKKAEKRMEGARRAIDETIQRIEGVKRKGKVTLEKTRKSLTKRRKKAWFEKFRWFLTSEGLLVIGGKDAVTNDILVKKHLEPHDLVFHADILGAPFVVIKTEGKTPSQQSICEAAQLAASHSRAWKFKFGAIDVYWVHPHQLSKTPPSGEYLKRGAFIIRGKKNYLRKTPLQLAIGIDHKTTPISVIGGPLEAVKSKTDISAEIIPGDSSSGELAKKVLQTLRRKAPKEMGERVSKIPLAEVQVFIPYGKGELRNLKS